MLIEYKKVKVYQQDNLILDDVDFHVDEGELVYLIGKVGSGKSSLLKTLYCEIWTFIRTKPRRLKCWAVTCLP